MARGHEWLVVPAGTLAGRQPRIHLPGCDAPSCSALHRSFSLGPAFPFVYPQTVVLHRRSIRERWSGAPAVGHVVGSFVTCRLPLSEYRGAVRLNLTMEM